MSNTTVIPLRQPATIDDPLTEVLRVGARELLAKAVEAEVEEFLAAHAGLRTADGHQHVVRHGHGPERQVQTGIGPVVVRRAKVRDRGDDETAGERIRFSSAILPKWARRSASLDALLPVLYLRGISTGDFQEALSALLGQDAPNLSAPVIARLKADWKADLARWQSRDLSARRYVYIWADGIHIQARMEENAQCILVIIGATPEGKKELVGFQIGYRESTQSWRELLVDLQARDRVKILETQRQIHFPPVLGGVQHWCRATPDDTVDAVAQQRRLAAGRGNDGRRAAHRLVRVVCAAQRQRRVPKRPAWSGWSHVHPLGRRLLGQQCPRTERRPAHLLT